MACNIYFYKQITPWSTIGSRLTFVTDTDALSIVNTCRNGDLNLLGLKEDHIIVYGIPWCGTSGIFTAEAYELGGIVLLGRDLQTDYLEELNPSEKVLRVMQRMISPAWTERQLSENLFFAGEIADRVPVLHLLCTKNASAACVMKNTIDQLEELQ